MQVDAHKSAVSLFQRYSKGGDNAKLKDWGSKRRFRRISSGRRNSRQGVATTTESRRVCWAARESGGLSVLNSALG